VLRIFVFFYPSGSQITGVSEIFVLIFSPKKFLHFLPVLMSGKKSQQKAIAFLVHLSEEINKLQIILLILPLKLLSSYIFQTTFLRS